MFSYIAKRADAIENNCLRILAYCLIIMTPIGLFLGLLESEFEYWIWLAILSGVFAGIGVFVALVVCLYMTLLSFLSKNINKELKTEPESSHDIELIKADTADLPTEQRQCRKCHNNKMVAINRDTFILDSYNFQCPECNHQTSITEPNEIGFYTGGSVVLFVAWLAFLLNDNIQNVHDYFPYAITLLVILFLPVSMIFKLWRYPITAEGQVSTASSEKTNDKASIWLAVVSFVKSFLVFIAYVIGFLGIATLIGIINDYGFEGLWNGQLWAIFQSGFQLLINLIW